jgi:sugar phosphate isomerase/epimerase
MRLGGPLFDQITDAAGWVAYCPIGPEADDATVQDYRNAARENNIVIAEVGAWSNPISPNEEERKTAIQKCQDLLAHADRMEALCSVNIAGSRSNKWDGPAADNLSAETFDLIVETTRAIIDNVNPVNTFYTLEMMPWIFPDSPMSYLRLIEAIDRPQCAVHLDPVNIVNSPSRFFDTGRLISRCFELLGPYIKSCHGKDIVLSQNLTVHLDETRPGLGGLDYAVFLKELDKLSPDIPLMLEHLPTEEEYRLAAEYIRSVAGENQIKIY